MGRLPKDNREISMIIENSGGGNGGSVFLAFLIGAVMVGVAIVGFFMWDNYKSGGHPAAPAINVTVKH
jgi:hypothetical protein